MTTLHFRACVFVPLILLGCPQAVQAPFQLMTCHELAQQIHQLQPDLAPVDVARLCLMILSQSEDLSRLRDTGQLMSAWKNATFRLEAASDQHAAVAAELEAICGDGPVQFTPDQLWVLLRAVKVQSQILELYTDEPALA